MGNIEIFSQHFHFVFTLLALGLLLFASIYATAGQDKLFSPLWMMFIGLVFDFAANAAASGGVTAYSLGQNIDYYVLSEMLLSLAAMLFLALSATRMLTGGAPVFWAALSLTVLGVLASVLFIFILPDGQIINNMRQIFPLAGFACLAVGFWSQMGRDYKSGFLLAALLASMVLVWNVAKMFNLPFSVMASVWYLPAFFYIGMAVAVLMMKVDVLNLQLGKSAIEIDKYNQKLEEIIRLSPFPIIISRLGDDRIILANNNAVKLFGINARELDRYRLRDFFADSDNRRLLSERLESEREVQDFEVLVKTPFTDTPFWLLASANIIDYNYDVALYSAFQDITSRKNREVLLKNQAIRDPLTSLYNRRYFEDEVTKLILDAKSRQQPYTVLMLDADFFKKVNDTYGHKVGDKVLIELSATAERALRDNDIVARYGGEEFVVFLPGVHPEQGRMVADRLRESISAQVVYSDAGEPVKFTVSIGVSSSEVSDNVDMLIKTADEALYRAKQNGRNRVELFKPDHLQSFDSSSSAERKDESQNHHPVFDKENIAEISLLDGVETGKMTNEKTFVEEPKK